MDGGVEIRDGESLRCERCGSSHVVKSFQWEKPVQIIVCGYGIQLVGIEHEPVPQRTIVEFARV